MSKESESTRPANVRLAPDVWDRVNALALRNGRTLSAEIRIAIRNYLAWNFSADALSLSEDTGCPPGCLSASGQAALAEGQGNAAEGGE